MKRFWTAVCLVWLVCGFGYGVAVAEEVETRMLVVFEDGVNGKQMEEKVEEAGGEVTETYGEVAMASVAVTKDAASELLADPSVKFVEEDVKIGLSVQMEDWGIESTNIPVAWNSGFTGNGVKVAIIDSGISQHKDLVVAGGVSTVGYTTSYSDDQGHGTHVAGIIGARNNGFGVKGVAYETELYAVKAFDNKGEAYMSDLVEAVNWSIENDMDIINFSAGTQDSSRALLTVMNKAYDSGLLIVAAAGNDGAPDGLDDSVDFPARYASVIGVGAVDRYFTRASFSSTGPAVEVAAPGVGILSTYLDNQYAYLSGTSMATPYVTGELALLKQAYPHLTNEELRMVLIEHTRDLGRVGRDPYFGYGFIQASSFLETIMFEEENPVTGLVLSADSITGSVGNSVNIKSTATYKNGDVKNVTDETVWLSANPAVATVTGGKVEFKSYGTTTVKGTYEGQSAILVVNVPEPQPQVEPNPIVKLEVNNTSLIGKPGDVIEVIASATFKNGKVQDVTNEANWSSDNLAIAKVTSGKVELNGYGSTTITVSFEGQSTMIVVNSPEPQPQAGPLFKDVTSFYSPAVTYLVRKQITRGISNTEFGTSEKIIRADAAIWLAKELDLKMDTAKASGFTDVPDRASGAVNALKEAGIVGGKTATRFGASESLTRGEVAIILQRAYNLSGDGSSSRFTDVSPRYQEAVESLVANGITDGVSANRFGVLSPITRGQLAVFLYRLSGQ